MFVQFYLKIVSCLQCILNDVLSQGSEHLRLKITVCKCENYLDAPDQNITLGLKSCCCCESLMHVVCSVESLANYNVVLNLRHSASIHI